MSRNGIVPTRSNSTDESLELNSFVADVYTELILRFARSINSASGTLFKAKLSPWAKGGPGKKAAPEGEIPEEPDTEPKKLDWIMTPELKLAVVRSNGFSLLFTVSRC